MTLPRISTFSLKLIVSVAIVVSILIIPLQTFELKPQSPNPKIAVRFSWPDVSAYIIEQDVTSKLEGVLSSLTDIKSIGSRSQRGAGSLILEFKPGSSLDICRFRVASAVRQVYSELPDNMTYPQVEVLHSSDQTVPILSYSIASIDDPVRIYDYVVSHITPQLRSLRGIDDVRIYGAAAPIIEVQFNPERLRNLEISTEDLASNIRNYFKTEFIGKGTEENERRRIEQTESKLVIRCFDNEDINWGSIPLKKIGERIIFLDDVATVVVSHPVPTSYSRTNGSNTVNILVYSKANTNLIQVSHEIRAMMDILKLDMPASFSLKLTNDTTQYLREQLAKLITQSAISLAVAFAIIGLVVGSLAYIFRLFALLSTTILISSVIYLVFSVHFHLYTISGIFISTFVITTDFLLLTFGRSRHRGNQFTTNMSCCLIAVFCFGAILLLDPIAQQNLKDFALVIVINSFVSFVVYTLLFKEGQIPVKTVRGRTQAFRIIRTRHAVVGVLSYIRRYRVLITLGLILSFGIPTTLIFEWITKFNLIQLNPKVVRVVEKSTGGAMRLFSEYVLISSFHTEPERTALHVKATMEEGSTVHQMNELLLNIETYIKQFQEIDSYNTLVTGPDNGSIDILFNESVSPEFPFYLKSKLEEQSIRLGGSDWSIYGVGTGFSNAIKQGFKSDYILLNGYSYEQLYDLALLLKQTLEKSSRVKGLEIAPEYSFDVRSPYEYHLDIDRDKLSAIEASQVEVFHAMNEQNAYKVISDLHFNGSQEVFLSSQENLDTWKIVNQPFTIGDRSHKMNGVLSLTKAQAVSDIYKMNQQYQLVVAYNFMGEAAQSEKFQRNIIAGLREKVPVGFRIVSPFDLSSNSNEFNQYYLLVMLIIGIYFICAAFFESFILPLAVCVIIPVAYIGVFLSFYLFEVNYDDGGFATFILITCVASHLAMIVCADVIYTHSSQSVLLRFQKAVMSSASRLPIILVVTIALLFSFVHGGKNVVFWYTICVGTISGVFFSLLGILIVLPMILPERIRSWRMK